MDVDALQIISGIALRWLANVIGSMDTLKLVVAVLIALISSTQSFQSMEQVAAAYLAINGILLPCFVIVIQLQDHLSQLLYVIIVS